MNNKVRKALYFIKRFLKNPNIPIPYKRMLFSAIVIGQVSYYAPLLGSNKERTRSTQTLKLLQFSLYSRLYKNIFYSLNNFICIINKPQIL